MNDFAEGMRNLTIQMPPFIMAVIFHEFGHGLIANYWGDSTAKDAGRLTLNPVPHIDPIGTLLFPMINMFTGVNIMFGWAKPVPINPRRFRKYRPGLLWVSLAGPGMNVVLAFLSAFAAVAMQRYAPQDFFLFEPLIRMTATSVAINYALAFFNLIPLPPLDGSKVIESFLPYDLAQKYESIAQYSFFILLGLMFTGVLSVLSYPIHFFMNLTLSLAHLFFSLF
jgi:Zn-dependent protease